MGHARDRFPLYAVRIRGQRLYLPMQEARDRHHPLAQSYVILGHVIEADGSVRDVTEAERQMIWAPPPEQDIDLAAPFPLFEMYRRNPDVPELMTLRQLVEAYFRPVPGQQGIRFGENVIEADGRLRPRTHADQRRIDAAIWEVKRRNYVGRLVPGRNVVPPKQPA